MRADDQLGTQQTPLKGDWKFTQCFGDKGTGDEPVQDADIISAVEFDYTGNYLATGDKGGRIVLFEGTDSKKRTREFKFYTEFQSHEPEFDYLKSLEIEEKINKIRWLRPQNNALLLLSTNDKTVKLWRVYHKIIPEFDDDPDQADEDEDEDEDEDDGNASGSGADGDDAAPSSYKPTSRSPPGIRQLPRKFSKSRSNYGSANAIVAWQGSQLKIPTLQQKTPVLAAYPRRTYANAHAYHINSISVGSDRETFISADDLRINLWNLNVSDQSFNIVDIKPANMEELTEVITAAEFHPDHCNHLVYSSSKGVIRLVDMRQQALCDRQAKIFEVKEDPSVKSFFSEIISSISDIKFSRDGKYLVSRDYLTLKLWDLTMEREPIRVIQIHDFLRGKLCDLYENDCIFDKFECCFSGDGKSIMTGSYSSYFHIYDLDKNDDTMLQADRQSIRNKKPAIQFPLQGAAAAASTSGFRFNLRNLGKKKEEVQQMAPIFNLEETNFGRKILHGSWHPTENVMAVAAVNNLFVCSQVSNSISSDK